MVFDTVTLPPWCTALDTCWQEVIFSNLEELNLSGSSPHLSVELLTELDCRGKPIRDLSPLLHLPKLKKLDISYTPVRDLSPLKDLPWLEELQIVKGETQDMRVVSSLPHLHILDISYPHTAMNNWDEIEFPSSLREIYCNACGVNSLEPFFELNELEVLSVLFNKISTEEVHTFKWLNPACKILY